MKYLTRETNESFSVSLRGAEEEQERQAILAENLFNTPVVDSYSGRSIEFKSNKQFKNFLFWQAIFNRYAPNNKFSFLKYGKLAAKDVREILNKHVFSLEELN
jgi:hypothetical protein